MVVPFTHCNTKLFWTSLAVQWLGLCIPSVGGVGLIPDSETRIPNAAQPKTNKQILTNKKFQSFLKITWQHLLKTTTELLSFH